MSDTKTFGERFARIIRIQVYVIFFIVLIVMVFITKSAYSEYSEAKALALDGADAKLACMERYRNAAIYDSNICMSCVEVKESSPQLLPRFNYWLVKIDGKMKNASGAWEKNKAECRVDKKTNQIISFSFPDQFGPLKSDPAIYKPSSELEIE